MIIGSRLSIVPSARLQNYLRIFLVPTLVNKAFILYFGLKYSEYPGEGYGYGLAFTVSLTLGSFAYFIWINWNEPEQEDRGSAQAPGDSSEEF